MSEAGRDSRLTRALDIFREVIELAPAERLAALAAACGGDAELRRQVEALIAADEQAIGFLETGLDMPTADAPADPPAAAATAPDWLGRRLGAFRLVREVGAGGMGTVFLAERCDGQFEQQAALKVARMGMSGSEAVRRLVVERQILAGLEHPNIARLLDGGVTEEGLPYFTMEYVVGQPLTDFCQRRAIGIAARLDLFLRVCAAVEHAHRRLIVHRDLKPSNILVTADGEVKLLDFGIAKLLGADDMGMTRSSEQPLTPAYAAPEQLRGETVTTATDVYALGLVLYEMLAGRRPYPEAGSTPGALAAAILSGEPAKPSTAGAPGTPGDGAAADPPGDRRWRRALRGDLDTIVLTALKREPERRYPSVEALAADVRRHLAGQPIAARPDTLRYRLSKFAARHRYAVAGAALLMTALVAALGIASWQARERGIAARRAERAAAAAQAEARFLVGLFESPDPSRALGERLTARELLDQGTTRLRSELAGQPVVRAELLHTVAATYVALGLYDRARPLAEEALGLRRGHLAGGDPQIAESLDQLGEIRRLQGAYAESQPLLESGLAIRRRAFGALGAPVGASLAHLGALRRDRGEFQAADGNYRQALAIAVKNDGPRSPATAQGLDHMAANLQDMGKYAEAAQLFGEALRIRQEAFGPNHPDVAVSLNNLGADLAALGKYAEAESNLTRALALRRRVLGPEHPAVAESELALGDLYDSMERYDDAEVHARRALDLYRRTMGDEDRKVTESLNLMAVLRCRRRDFAGAVPILRQALERVRRSLGPDHPDALAAEDSLSYALAHAGGLAEAEQLQRAILVQARTDNGQMAMIDNRLNLAETLLAEGRPAEAEQQAREAVAWQQRLFGEKHEDVSRAERFLAIAEAANGKTAAAEADFRAALQAARALVPASEPQVVRSQIAFGDFLVGARREGEAVAQLSPALASLEKTGDSDPIWRAEAQLLLGECLRRRGDAARGGPLLAAGRKTLRALSGVSLDLYPTTRALLAGR